MSKPSIIFLMLLATLLPTTASAQDAELISVDFVEYKGRTGHGGHLPIQGQPSTGEAIVVVDILLEDASVETLEIIDPDGSLTSSYTLNSTPESNIYFAEVILTDAFFQVQVSGTFVDQTPFSIVWDQVHEPKSLAILIKSRDPHLIPHTQYTYDVDVTNRGEGETFMITYSNSLGFMQDIYQTPIFIPQNSTVTLSCSLDVIEVSKLAKAIDITVNARIDGDYTMETYKTSTLSAQILPYEPIGDASSSSDQFCITIKATNGKVFTICL